MTNTKPKQIKQQEQETPSWLPRGRNHKPNDQTGVRGDTKNTFIDDELFSAYHFLKDRRVADFAKFDNGLTDCGRQDSFFFLHGALRPQKP